MSVRGQNLSCLGYALAPCKDGPRLASLASVGAPDVRRAVREVLEAQTKHDAAIGSYDVAKPCQAGSRAKQ